MKLDRSYKISHSRVYRTYEAGETPARYGVAMQCEDGTYEFLSEWGNWSKTSAHTWTYPPDHYLITRGKKLKDAFIVNFNKPSSPKPTNGYLR